MFRLSKLTSRTTTTQSVIVKLDNHLPNALAKNLSPPSQSIFKNIIVSGARMPKPYREMSSGGACEIYLQRPLSSRLMPGKRQIGRLRWPRSWQRRRPAPSTSAPASYFGRCQMCCSVFESVKLNIYVGNEAGEDVAPLLPHLLRTLAVEGGQDLRPIMV